jgi:hypothetical protein
MCPSLTPNVLPQCAATFLLPPDASLWLARYAVVWHRLVRGPLWLRKLPSKLPSDTVIVSGRFGHRPPLTHPPTHPPTLPPTSQYKTQRVPPDTQGPKTGDAGGDAITPFSHAARSCCGEQCHTEQHTPHCSSAGLCAGWISLPGSCPARLRTPDTACRSQHHTSAVTPAGTPPTLSRPRQG